MKRIIPILPWLGALLLIAVALLSFECDLLWKIQQYNLFLDTSLFFREQMLVPGGFLSYISCYFTQFFFHPWLGVLMLCGWWLLLMWVTKRAFRIADNWAALALIPVALLLIANMDLGYWHYFMKLQGYLFVPTIGTTTAVAMLWAFRVLPQNLWLHIAWVVLATAIGYPTMGFYALAAVLLMAIWTWLLNKNKQQNAILTGVALLSIVAVPLLCYRYIYYQTNIDDIWTTALPTFTIGESYAGYYIPYYILGAFFLLMVLLYQTALPALWQKPLYRWSLQGILIVALVAGVWHYWYKDENFHHELVMQHCIEETDWEGVISESEKQVDEPTRAIVVMRNLALTRLGRMLNERYNFPYGGKKSNTPLPFDMMYHVFGRMLYYQYGLLNDCHRMCMEEGVEYGWRVEIQKYLARCSMLMGEKQAAQNALNRLRHTQFHGLWADEMQQLLNHPKQIAENRETGPVSHMLHYVNALGSDGGNVEKYIMGQLGYQDSDDPYFQEQAVFGTLWTRDSKQFWPRFFHYAKLYPNTQMPHIFQEAAYLFGKQENRTDIDKMPFDASVKKTYNSFMKEIRKYDNQSAEIGRTALYPFYGNTYYYEYYFLRNTK